MCHIHNIPYIPHVAFNCSLKLAGYYTLPVYGKLLWKHQYKVLESDIRHLKCLPILDEIVLCVYVSLFSDYHQLKMKGVPTPIMV